MAISNEFLFILRFKRPFKFLFPTSLGWAYKQFLPLYPSPQRTDFMGNADINPQAYLVSYKVLRFSTFRHVLIVMSNLS